MRVRWVFLCASFTQMGGGGSQINGEFDCQRESEENFEKREGRDHNNKFQDSEKGIYIAQFQL